ncbi:MAG TPA: dihydropteroate synthase [Candidatus Limnocylindrales bacterium]|nr:dihydropteroate synthase [Candidatus Limnocylindrales bacterium]
MTDRSPTRPDVVAARPELGGGATTPSFGLPADAPTGIPGPAARLQIGPAPFDWGTRTFVMGILNVTPDSFSGDGLLASTPGATDPDPVAAAVAIGRRMVDEGADLLDVGGESTRPGHEVVADDDEIARVVPIVRALRAALPDTPLSIDTTKVAVAAAALDAGANLVNDVWGVGQDDALLRLAAAVGAPIVLMHNRAEARYMNLMAEVVADLQRAIERAIRCGIAPESIVIDPGFGFGKTPAHNLVLLRDLAILRILGRPILLGTSRKSTLGKVLDLPADQRLEATLATTALGVAAGVDIVRVHDVRANVRAARMADAIVRRPGPSAAHPTEGDQP